MTPTVAALLTSHDRREKTLACLRSLLAQRGDFAVTAFLVDSSSPDGTGDAVRAALPEVVVTTVPDDTFWGTGTRLAAERAGEDFDFHLWLNDDVTLDDGALATLLRTTSERHGIAVGALRDPQGFVSYSGLRRTGPVSFELVSPADVAVPCDTFNGNVVLVPRDVRAAIGAIDVPFRHAMGDIDYGLRARAAGFASWVAPGVVGTCVRNHEPAVKERAGTTLRDRVRHVKHVKRLPPRAWWTFCTRHAGVRGVAYFAAPYVRAVVGR